MQSLSRCRQACCLLFFAQVVGLSVVFYYVLLRIRPELFYQQKHNAPELTRTPVPATERALVEAICGRDLVANQVPADRNH